MRRLHRAGVLKHIVLVGGWCKLLYRQYLLSPAYAPALRTRDIDLLVPRPSALASRIDVADLLRDLGFVVGFTGREGYIRLEHPQLIIEFPVPERGRPIDRPYPLPDLGLNAQALGFPDFLAQKTTAAKLREITVTLLHPVNFALHKLLVLSRRPTLEKQTKDKEAAIRILRALLNKGEQDVRKNTFHAMPQRWRMRVKRQLTDSVGEGLLQHLVK